MRKSLSILTAAVVAAGLSLAVPGDPADAAGRGAAPGAAKAPAPARAASDTVTPLARAARLLTSTRPGRVPWARSPRASETVRPNIVGGSPVSIRTWPWIVSLQDTDGGFANAGEGGHVCGGSLIAPQWVLSARHCFRLERFNPDRVVLGQTRLSGTGGQVVAIDGVVMHPFGNPSELARDFTLVHLAEPADVARPDIEPIALLAPGEADWAAAGASARTAGWGTTDTREGDAPDDLQGARVRIADDAACQATWDRLSEMDGGDSSGMPIIVPDVMVCADSGPGVPGWRGQNVCNGDSGGPLVVYDPDDKSPAGARLVGVTSFGYECGSSTVPSVFAEPAGVRDAIDAIVDGTTPVSTLSVSLTGATATIGGTDRADRILLYCDGGLLRADLVSIGSPPARCGTDDVTAVDAQLGSGNDLLVFDLTADEQASITDVTFDGAGQRSSVPPCDGPEFSEDFMSSIIDSVRCSLPVGDGFAVIAWSKTPTTIQATGAGTVDGNGVVPDLALSGLEGVFVVGTANDDDIDMAALGTSLAIVTQGGRDRVVGSSEPDFIDVGSRDDQVDAGPGDDFVVGGSGDDTIAGGDGIDLLLGFEGIDTIDAGPGDDTYTWGPGDGPDRVTGGDGNDLIQATVWSSLGDGFSGPARAGLRPGAARAAALALARTVLAERRARAVAGPDGTTPGDGEEPAFDDRVELTRSAGEARLRVTMQWSVGPTGGPVSDRIDLAGFDRVFLQGSFGGDLVVVDPGFTGPTDLILALMDGTDHVYTAPLVGTAQQIVTAGKRDRPADLLVVNALGRAVSTPAPPPVLRTPGRAAIVSTGFEQRVWTNVGGPGAG